VISARSAGHADALVTIVVETTVSLRSKHSPRRDGSKIEAAATGSLSRAAPRGAHKVSDVLEEQEPQPPRGHVRVVYLGPVAPHWDVQSDYGDEALVDQFRDRTLARLTLLPPHDPQFRRNRERVVRDAERELLELEWDLGVPDEPDTESEVETSEAEA